MKSLSLILVVLLFVVVLFSGCISGKPYKQENATEGWEQTTENNTIKTPDPGYEANKTQNNGWANKTQDTKPETENGKPEKTSPDQLSPELKVCIENALGVQAWADISAHKIMPTSAEIVKIDNCFEQFGDAPEDADNKTQDSGPGTGNEEDHGPKTFNGQMYAPYPDTDQTPVLEFFWGPPDLDVSKVTRLTPYGCWEDWKEYPDGTAYEPAVEMQFYTTTFHDPVLAVAPGVVIDATNGEDEHPGMVIIAYGKNYGVTYHHIVTVPASLKPGMKIEAGTVLGYTEKRLNPGENVYEGWWEISLDSKQGELFRSLPPYGYFSEKSKAKLDAILDAVPYWSVMGSQKTWTVTQGCSWAKYLGKPEWWTSATRVGYAIEENETEAEFMAKINPSWKLMEQGRVIGPTDECK